MNAGLSNLATLKAWLLPESLRAATDYDAQILAIGLGIAGQLESFCNRKFARVEDATCETSANRSHVSLDRFPIEQVTTIEVRESLADGWVDQGTINEVVENISAEAGLVGFGVALSALPTSRLRVTFTGGFFWEQLEPDDVGYPTAQPDGSTALDDTVRLAWLLQCEHVWAQRDKLGLAIGKAASEIYGGALAKIELLPAVREKLAGKIRFSLL
jgi:hypothetical protein